MSTDGGLNEAQKQAVLHKEGALLILAGAGAGKTRVITHRIAELIKSGVAPEKILAVTFTNKAAKEMRERTEKLVTSDLQLSPYDMPKTRPFMGTFHSLALEILKTFHEKAGLPRRFTIYDRSDSTRALKEAIKEAGFDPKELEPRRVLSAMGKHKGNAVNLETFRSDYSTSYIDEAIAEVWEKYAKILSKEKALDFDDILIRALELLKKDAQAREHFQNAWDFIHVDEYQDTNRVQYELVHLLSHRHGNIAAVGDVDQNIYSWRGASIEHIMNFESDFPNAKVLVLAENYRSTQTILTAANDAIAKNTRRREKELFTKNDAGEKITVAGFTDENEEAMYIAKEAKYLIAYGVKPEAVAVLYRANFQSRALEEAFLKENVPYQVLGTRFYERKEIKDALSYLRLALNPDSAADLSRAISSPSRGIGKVTLAKIVNRMEEGLPSAARKKVEDFRAVIGKITRAISEKKPSETVRYALMESGLWRMYEKGEGEDAERLENLKELVTVATKYDTLAPEAGIEKLIEEASLASDQDEINLTQADVKKAGVKLMTVHAAKGLEFERVFVTGLEEGLFPHERDSSDGVDSEEERRLFYVALTRAQKKVYLTWAMTRRIFGTRSINTPSEFITELESDLTEVVAFEHMYDTID
jgi:DNA helicase-2/ATP-dependent DNA helicase PcrA